jgi:hypothetical protein
MKEALRYLETSGNTERYMVIYQKAWIFGNAALRTCCTASVRFGRRTHGGYKYILSTLVLLPAKAGRKKCISETGVLIAVVGDFTYCKKGKTVPLQAWSGPEGSRKLRFPYYMTTAQDGGNVVSLTHRLPLPPGTHFCYSLSRPQGHSAIGRIMSMRNSNDTIRNRTSDPPICSTVP